MQQISVSKMRRYLISFLLGCVVEVKPDQETIEIESSKGARLNWHGLQQQPVAPTCTTAPRRYYTKTYCPKFYTSKCHVIRCPVFSCLETAFFETEAETRSSLEMGVKFRKGSRGVTISSKGRGIRTKACNAAHRDALGCDNFAEVTFGPNMRVFDEDTNTQYLLAEVSAACGGPFYQPVLIGGCCSDYCCNNLGRCHEIRKRFKFLVQLRDGRTQVKDVRMTVGCVCQNVQKT